MALPPYQQFLDALRRSERPVIALAKEPNIDSIAAALALKLILERRGKKTDIISDGYRAPAASQFLPKAGAILPGFSQLQRFIISLDISRTKVDELAYDVVGDKLEIAITPKTGAYEPRDVTTRTSGYKYDLIIAIDSPDYPSLGAAFSLHPDFFYGRPTVVIDSEPSNEQFGNINLVDITATSAAEIIARAFGESGDAYLTEDVATCLLAGMIAKTKSFRSATVTPKALEIAAQLVAAGARREEIIQHLYRTKPLSALKLWGRALSRLKFDQQSGLAWTLLIRQDFVQSGADESALDAAIEELLLNSPEAEIVGLLYEHESENGSDIRAIVASEKYPDPASLVASLSPESGRKLARVRFATASITEAEKQLFATIAASVARLHGRPPAKAAEAEKPQKLETEKAASQPEDKSKTTATPAPAAAAPVQPDASVASATPPPSSAPSAPAMAPAPAAAGATPPEMPSTAPQQAPSAPVPSCPLEPPPPNGPQQA